MPDVERTEEELIALFANNTSRNIDEQDARDLITTLFARTPLTIPHLGNQGFIGPILGADDFWRFPVAPPYQYSFELMAFLSSDGPAIARLGIRLPAVAFSYIDAQTDDELHPIDDSANYVEFAVAGGAVKSMTHIRTGWIDVGLPGEAVFLWGASEEDRAVTVGQASLLKVYRSID